MPSLSRPWVPRAHRSPRHSTFVRPDGTSECTPRWIFGNRRNLGLMGACVKLAGCGSGGKRTPDRETSPTLPPFSCPKKLPKQPAVARRPPDLDGGRKRPLFPVLPPASRAFRKPLPGEKIWPIRMSGPVETIVTIECAELRVVQADCPSRSRHERTGVHQHDSIAAVARFLPSFPPRPPCGHRYAPSLRGAAGTRSAVCGAARGDSGGDRSRLRQSFCLAVFRN